MTMNWEVFWISFGLMAVVFLFWRWSQERAMHKRVDRHASEQWRKRQEEKDKHDGWMG